MFSHFSHVWLFMTLWTVACQAPLSMGFSRQEYWRGFLCPPPGIFPTQGSNPSLLHSRRILYCLATGEAPRLTLVMLLLSFSRVGLFETPWTAACHASLSCTVSWSLLKLMSIESVMPSHHLILCYLLLLLPSIFPSIKVFSNVSALHIRWPKYWSFSFSISPSNEYPWLISFRYD